MNRWYLETHRGADGIWRQNREPVEIVDPDDTSDAEVCAVEEEPLLEEGTAQVIHLMPETLTKTPAERFAVPQWRRYEVLVAQEEDPAVNTSVVGIA